MATEHDASTVAEDNPVTKAVDPGTTGNRRLTSTTDAASQQEHTLPVITEHDLLEYHKTHFPGLAPPTTFFVDPSTIAHLLPSELASQLGVGEEEDDGLGYYHDGVKRTLTDEQIAMFRHSELLQIEREGKQKEKAIRDAAPAFDAHVALKAEYAAQLARQKEQESKKRKEEVPYAARHKRKWEGYIGSEDPKHGSITHRRLARELDEQVSTAIEIDYGDSVPAPEPRQASVDTSARRVISYADD